MEGIKVTNTQKIERYGSTGTPEVYYRVSYTTAKRATGIIEIPEDDFTAEALPEILEKERDRVNLAFDIANGD